MSETTTEPLHSRLAALAGKLALSDTHTYGDARALAFMATEARDDTVPADDLAACRALLAALVAAEDALIAANEQWMPAPVCAKRRAIRNECVAKLRAWLAAHPVAEADHAND